MAEQVQQSPVCVCSNLVEIEVSQEGEAYYRDVTPIPFVEIEPWTLPSEG